MSNRVHAAPFVSLTGIRESLSVEAEEFANDACGTEFSEVSWGSGDKALKKYNLAWSRAYHQRLAELLWENGMLSYNPIKLRNAEEAR